MSSDSGLGEDLHDRHRLVALAGDHFIAIGDASQILSEATVDVGHTVTFWGALRINVNVACADFPLLEP